MDSFTRSLAFTKFDHIDSGYECSMYRKQQHQRTKIKIRCLYLFAPEWLETLQLMNEHFIVSFSSYQIEYAFNWCDKCDINFTKKKQYWLYLLLLLPNKWLFTKFHIYDLVWFGLLLQGRAVIVSHVGVRYCVCGCERVMVYNFLTNEMSNSIYGKCFLW